MVSTLFEGLRFTAYTMDHEPRHVTTDAEVEAALEEAKKHDLETLARKVEHIPGCNLLVIRLNNGRRLVLPMEELQGLEQATHEQMHQYELLGRGTGISFPALDVDLYVPA